MKATSKQKSALSHRITKYSAGAGSALAAGFGAAPQAQAAIDYYNPADLTISPGGNLYFDLDDSAGGTLASTSSFAGADFGVFFFFSANEKPDVYSLDSYDAVQLSGSYADRLGYGATIGSSQTFGNAAQMEISNTGPWQGGGEGYLGLRLSSGPNFNYGWARLNYDDAGNQITLLDFAIDNSPDTAITAGAIPEPSHGLLALAAGAAGLAAWRRRKRS